MKKMTFILSALSFFAITSTAYAQGFVPLAPIPNLTEGITANTAGLATFFNNLYKYLIGLAAALAVIQIIWAGLDIAIWHKDAVSAITDDKEKIYNAVFGLILVLSPVLVFSIINPSILNLSLSLPELKTASGVPAGTGGGAGTPLPTTTDPATLCSVTGGNYFKTLSCPNTDAAKSFKCGDLTLQVNNCKNVSPQGKCLDAPVIAYCKGGQSPTLTYYYYYGSYGGTSKDIVIPAHKAALDTFTSSCESSGGVLKGAPQSNTGTETCSADFGIVIDSTKWKGVWCGSYKVSCSAP